MILHFFDCQTFNDNVKKGLILSSLPESYDSFVQVSSAQDKLLNQSLNDVNAEFSKLTALKQKTQNGSGYRVCKRKEKRENQSQQDEASPKYESQSQQKGRSSKRGIQCYRCNNLGHHQRDCWSKVNVSEVNKQSSKSKENKST